MRHARKALARSTSVSVDLLTSNETNVSTEVLNKSIEKLFVSDADTVLLFFAGHGIINHNTNAGYIVSQNGAKGAWGMSLSDILALANAAYPRIKSTVIILDSCNSGFAGEASALGNEKVAIIGTGVTIQTACHREGTAAEVNGRGLFSMRRRPDRRRELFEHRASPLARGESQSQERHISSSRER